MRVKICRTISSVRRARSKRAFYAVLLFLVCYSACLASLLIELSNEQTDTYEPTNFRINAHNACRTADPFLLIFVHSSIPHFEKRHLIRDRLNYRRNETRIVFLFVVGTTRNGTIQRTLQAEAALFNDILQIGVLDSYRNITYKAIAWLEWTMTYCRGATYVLKTDDDVQVQSFLLVQQLAHVHQFGLMQPKSIVCFMLEKRWLSVDRNIHDKHYVSPKEYSPNAYPPFCLGAAYILSMDLIQPLYAAAQRTPFFWVDDALVTGILAQRVGARHYSINKRFVRSVSRSHVYKEKIVSGAMLFGSARNLITNEQYWSLMKERATNISILPLEFTTSRENEPEQLKTSTSSEIEVTERVEFN